ncbi:MAG: hypothetical protein J6Z40_11620 [Oscillospiraceae bacterium]|nr:hypothetical protein [Oscillospiraceae bacterium]
MECKECSQEWQKRYNLAVQRFDKALSTAMTVTIIALCITLICVIISAVCLGQTIKFIKGFEYVEETIVSQDGNGQNIAVLVDGNS